MNIRLAGIMGLFAIGSVTAASAADLPAPIYTKAPPPVVAYNWTGCYGGGNVGGIFPRTDWWQIGGIGQRFSSATGDSWLAGLQVGCNYQFSGTGWVIGIQGDYDWSDATGSAPHSTLLTLTDQSHISGLGSVTGRVGYAWDRFLGYVKGGGAWQRTGYLQYFPATGATFATGSSTLDGWTVGIGGEYGFTPNLSVFLEYDYYDFGTRTVTLAAAAGGFPQINIHETESVVRAGLNWRFNWAGPVVAKY